MKKNNLKISRILILITLIVLGYSCSQKESDHVFETENIMLKDTEEAPVLATAVIEEESTLDSDKTKIRSKGVHTEQKIIRNANCRIKVKNVEKATKLARKVALDYLGYVSDERFTNTNYTKENHFTIRIPKNEFNIVLDSICGLAEFVDYKNITTVDVTEEYIDITTRLKTKQEVKERYETILRTKAKTVEDILKTEEKLSKIQEEIESAQGRLNYMRNKVSYSTIQVDLYETIIPKEEPDTYEPDFLNKAKKGMSFGWSIIENLILLLFYIWPFLIVGTVIFIYFKWIRKAKK
ncbi:DUF4349 domain-containing protein [Aquimarina aquimarini]|uniref:DUF4349 domain-containing protein n=1 Tax=Aquimarina aquimarini TaxID=1191734 RepID=UPI000D5557CC|nr:DUF4349 domain-containing protein [Aquimarina aquimarini]